MAMRNSVVCFFFFVLLHIFLSALPTQSAPETALVTELPGFNGTIPSKHYAGYVTVDESQGRNLYYYFAESEGNPSEDPVVLWLNGGPGCSSFDGFVYEHGPFNFEKAKTRGSMPTLHLNPYSWSKVSNIIYLDSPTGVGFSYSKNSFDYPTGDLRTASESHTFLLKWFELYPEFLSNPFFIAGESYAGIYVPTLAYEVAKGIEAGTKPYLNFKGYLVGNGCADDQFDGNALVPFAHGMGLISDELYEETRYVCNGNYYNPVNDICQKLIDKVNETIDGINIYNTLEPCYHGQETVEATISSIRLPTSFKQLGATKRPLPVRKRMFGRSWPLRAPVKDGIVPTWPELSSSTSIPCTDDEVATTWLNNATVRKAIHTASESDVKTWTICTDNIAPYVHDAGSMLKFHWLLTSKGYRALIYSGDHDMCVPFTGTQAWTSSMGYRVVDEWRPWIVNNQVAGYIQGYEKNLTFMTIKGAGHTVPEYKPQESLYFYKRFLDGLPI
ncbi:serine carboxypeptidase-like 20 [Prosopis cineraria]|uniref:serine carboxypeptidase-like 20 n=1 Tax=Prosopis cineraria TaxID=364024 RepID=UPI00240F81B4|nr:serine carboxypeptidase-like 20 [Prosopis cineraria]